MLSLLLVNCFHRVSRTFVEEPSTYNMLPNLPAPMSPIWIGLPLASRSASLVERLVMVGGVLSRSFFSSSFLFDAEPAAAIKKQLNVDMSKKRSYELPAESRKYLCSEVALSEDQHPASKSNSLGKSKDHLWRSSAILSIRVCLEGVSDLYKTPTTNNYWSTSTLS
jgi:hypothetical protein